MSASHRKKCPEIRNFFSNSLGSSCQHKYTWNLLDISSDYSENNTRVCLVTTHLHIKLGIVNKVFDSLDLIVCVLSYNHDLGDSEENVYVNYLAACLFKVWVRREKYYSVKMTGGPYSYFMKRMNDFCSLFFEQLVSSRPILEQIPEICETKTQLLSAAAFFNDSEDSSRKGVGF